MNKWIDYSNMGGFPLTQNMLDHMQQSYREALGAIAKFLGDKVIITGLVEAGGEATSGWITYSNEMVPFTGGAIAGGDIIVETLAFPRNFENGSSPDVLFYRSARFGSPATFNYSELKRLDTVKTLQTTLKDLIAAYNAHTHAWADITGKPAGYITHVGSYAFGDVSSDTKLTVTIPDQGGTAYKVIGTFRGTGVNWNNDNDISFVVYNPTAISFDIAVREYASVTQSLVFDFIIVKTL